MDLGLELELVVFMNMDLGLDLWYKVSVARFIWQIIDVPLGLGLVVGIYSVQPPQFPLFFLCLATST
jgi:hypothetical protein